MREKENYQTASKFKQDFKKTPKLNYLLFAILLIGAVFTWFSFSTMWDRLSIDVEGVVISRQVGHFDTIYQIYVDYTIQQDDGAIVRYRAKSNDPSLSRDIPIGSQLIKKKWDFNYFINGSEIKDL